MPESWRTRRRALHRWRAKKPLRNTTASSTRCPILTGFPCLSQASFLLFLTLMHVLPADTLRRAAGANGSGVGGAAGPGAGAAAPLATPEEARAQLGRTTSAYLRFLDEALAFYRKTVWKLQWVYGSMGAQVGAVRRVGLETGRGVGEHAAGRVNWAWVTVACLRLRTPTPAEPSGVIPSAGGD